MKRLGVFVFFLVFGLCSAQFSKYKICATPAFTSECNILQRGTSEVSCHYVQDSIECAQLVKNNTVQFGVFSAETTLLLAKLNWDELVVVKELHHTEQVTEPSDFSSVVLVKKPNFQGGLENLRGSTFCHPGLHYTKQNKWTERFLKEFERAIEPVQRNCQAVQDASIEELEIASLLKFFRVACRPGSWSNNPEEDAKLKSKYPSLCSLCDNPGACTYNPLMPGSDHRKALECLKAKGEVTYVSLQEAAQFLRENTDTASQYQFFCPNGTVQPALTSNPCVWLSQPWPVILTNGNHSVTLNKDIDRWITGTDVWQQSVKDILTSGNMVVRTTSVQPVDRYFVGRRQIPVEQEVCESKITWCTASTLENEKCNVVRAGGITTGVYPLIECRTPAAGPVRCMNDIAQKNADFMGIDSNLGYIARHNFDLSPAMYAETDDQHYSRVVILIKDGAGIQRFEDLRSRKVCFPEFGGIASIAFVDVGRNRGLFSRNECNYGKLLASYFGDSCAPGAKDVLHDQKFKQSSPEAEKLCRLCDNQAFHATRRFSPDLSAPVSNLRKRRQLATGYCTPTKTNRYFGTRGALQCFEESGEVAILEIQRAKDIVAELRIDTSAFRIMCRDGSIVPVNNFDIPVDCPLVTIVDGEIVIRRNSTKQRAVVSALNSFDRYFNLNEEPNFSMFRKFDGHLNVLFEDSTVGFISTNSTTFGPSVQNYIRLFKNVESCQQKNGSVKTSVNLFFIISAILFTFVRF